MFRVIPQHVFTEPRASLISVDRDATTLHIDGLVCSACASRVRSRLERVDGVTGASVDLATGDARVHCDSARAGPEALIAAAEGAVILRPLRRWIARAAS
jgi:Cu+-exporting ATPase